MPPSKAVKVVSYGDEHVASRVTSDVLELLDALGGDRPHPVRRQYTCSMTWPLEQLQSSAGPPLSRFGPYVRPAALLDLLHIRRASSTRTPLLLIAGRFYHARGSEARIGGGALPCVASRLICASGPAPRQISRASPAGCDSARSRRSSPPAASQHSMRSLKLRFSFAAKKKSASSLD